MLWGPASVPSAAYRLSVQETLVSLFRPPRAFPFLSLFQAQFEPRLLLEDSPSIT